MRVAAILLCAGRGQRLGAGIDKALVPLAGRPLFTWSLETLARTRAIEASYVDYYLRRGIVPHSVVAAVSATIR
jgi:2-C-methyl-D-erythritol 4-phosphate cytidylyltransferase